MHTVHSEMLWRLALLCLNELRVIIKVGTSRQNHRISASASVALSLSNPADATVNDRIIKFSMTCIIKYQMARVCACGSLCGRWHAKRPTLDKNYNSWWQRGTVMRYHIHITDGSTCACVWNCNGNDVTDLIAECSMNLKWIFSCGTFRLKSVVRLRDAIHSAMHVQCVSFPWYTRKIIL